MKIDLKLDFVQLSQIIVVLQENAVRNQLDTIQAKANWYLFQSALKKLLKKQIDKFEKREAFSIRMSYPEASSLWLNLQKVERISDDYRRNVWLKVTSELHQKLSA